MSGPSLLIPISWFSEFCDKHLEHIQTFYNVKVQKTDDKCFKSNKCFIVFQIDINEGSSSGINLEDASKIIQKYVDSIMASEPGEEDSSYDSECDDNDDQSSHQSVSRTNSDTNHRSASRTPSDTLAAEFAEYVNVSPAQTLLNSAKIEFAIKLGYSESLARTALLKLGPDPSQNELLAELIKLGAGNSSQVHGASTTSSNVETRHVALRPVVIDGSNVAMSHGNKEVFSCRGIDICVEWFKSRGHRDITVFVPKWRKEATRPDNPVVDREVLDKLERSRTLVFTPSRMLGGKRFVCYDDRYILNLAVATDAIVVSNDNYRDLARESSEFHRVVEERLLMYSFVNDRFMPPDDPLGRNGPNLDTFLRMPEKKDGPSLCPYGRKCTYGNKCKFYHPERAGQPHRTVAERLSERAVRMNRPRDLQTYSLPPTSSQVYVANIPRAHSAAVLAHDVSPQENPHKKLARQLTLLPNRDPRLPGLLAAAGDRNQHMTAVRVSSAPVPSVRDLHEERGDCLFIDARNLMRSRLVGIFPEQQVDETMLAFPIETDARRMCAIILERYKGR